VIRRSGLSISDDRHLIGFDLKYAFALGVQSGPTMRSGGPFLIAETVTGYHNHSK
jgi:hypothetical protein